ncbi:hypothetical protein HU200_027663 [Digitaria exilis]|uniref:Bowman-Birk serine protease inhibitors family domain-containing protein n=1 Tax=Digitaria exilis TaxID=1010633 RepID=A0A835BXX9_9POAL|nr:hypothetical protein HU200_027663 [Digitaria exilis]
MNTRLSVLATLLVALRVVLAAAAAHSGTDTTIRLPISSIGGSSSAPWDCCDFVARDPAFRPPRWQCNDVLGECPTGCHECEESLAGDGYVCLDWVVSLYEPPVCTPRPWDCCDFAVCTRAYVPICWCADQVESCSSRCKECEEVGTKDTHRYRCLDRFLGYPGPKCTPWISKDDTTST